LRALQKERALRQQSATEVRTQIETVAANPGASRDTVKIPASHHIPAARRNPWPRRLFLLIAAIILLPIGSVVLYLLLPAIQTKKAPRGGSDKPGVSVTKIVELSKVSVDATNISAWTSSDLGPGSGVAAVTKTSGREMEDAHTHTIIYRRHYGKQMTTIFSWRRSDLLDSNQVASANGQMQAHVGRPLILAHRDPLPLFALTNSLGSIVQGYLEYRPVMAAEVSTNHASVSFRSAASPIPSLVLGYYDTAVPAGCIMEAGGTLPDGVEGEVHTSFVRSSTYRSDNCSWHIPSTFTAEQARAGADQLTRLAKTGPIFVRPNERIEVFSITNDAGGVYRGFFELLAPQ
jgi:hypothetical protein